MNQPPPNNQQPYWQPDPQQQWQQPWDLPPPPQKKRGKGAFGCLTGFLTLLLIIVLVLFCFGLLRNLVPPGWESSTLPPLPTAASTTLPPRAPGDPPHLPQAGRVRSHYKALAEDEKQAYDAILTALPEFPERIEIPRLGENGISNVYYALLRDHPLLFHLSSESMTKTSGGKTWFCPAYRMNRAEYEKHCKELEAVCASIAVTIPEDATQFETELALHDALVGLCDYSYTGSADENTAYGALVLGKAACEGYSRALVLLLDQQGIDCCIITGDATNSTGETSKHAWNKVRIDGAWYQVDSTWNDPVGADGGSPRSPLHSYFNLTDAEMGLTHALTPDDMPCTATKANYFAVKGLLFRQIDRDAEAVLAQTLAEAVDAGAELLEFRCETRAAYDAAVERLFEDQRIYRILSNADIASRRKISSQRVSFTEIKALHILQIIPVLG
ncbi:MAG: hypothetical protein LBS96_07815 [Oscillospiraceae bacterium]|jgi:hypothetical protein|nr:hypothetical protein [Oscillospiraceae bacterium]